jgi:chromate transporter
MGSGRMKRPRHSLAEVALLFLKLGTISFGGPAAHVALMEQEAVRKRSWLSQEHFLDLLAATNLVPGPNAVEMAVHIGYVRAGWPGLFAGGLGFVTPAFLITLALSWAYVRFGTLPQGAALLYGINPAVIAVVLTVTYRLGRTALSDRRATALFVACLTAALLGIDEVVVMLGAGVAGLLLYAEPQWPWFTVAVWGTVLPLWGPRFQAALGDSRLWQLALFFLKTGFLLFGSGMVLFALIHRDVVVNLGWLSEQQLRDAIAVGQMTPGPVASSATFIGYAVGGVAGALVATVAMFLPCFVIVALTGPWIPHLRQSALAQAFLRGVNVGVVALILAVGLALFRGAVVDIWTALILVASLAALLRWRVDTLWLVVGGGAAGLVHFILISGAGLSKV